MDIAIENSWRELIYSFVQAPLYHIYFELVLIIGIIWLFFKRSYKPLDKISLTTAEKEELINEWSPEPLVPANWQPSETILKNFNRTIISPIGKYVVLEENPDNKCLNVASFNFLNIIGDPVINKVAIDTLRKYGVGSCGPRGFYGTMDVHLKLEEELADFMNCEEAIVYSYGFSTIASAIPAYAKRTDVIFVDEGVSFAIQRGLDASRSTIHFYKHNNMADLERLLKLQAVKDEKDPNRAKCTRRFIVTEGLFINYGDVCLLSELVELKYKYKVRIFLDETMSFGVLGHKGRGVTEYWGMPTNHIDLISGSLETAIGSCGGFCVGSKYVIDHQRLSGQGYCFSASLPPLLATSASFALKKIIDDDGTCILNLNNISKEVQERLSGSEWAVSGDIKSPVKHIRLREGNSQKALEDIVERALKDDVLLTVARYLDEEEHLRHEPSIRLALNCDLNKTEVDKLIEVLISTAKSRI